MSVLYIYNLDDQEEKSPISTLFHGEHVIGREKLNCTDKRVSRNHAVIIVNENDVILKSMHLNPSFYKTENGNGIKLIKKDESTILKDGDQFALLPDQFWFKVRIESGSSCLKRPNTPLLEEKCKKIKVNENHEIEKKKCENVKLNENDVEALNSSIENVHSKNESKETENGPFQNISSVNEFPDSETCMKTSDPKEEYSDSEILTKADVNMKNTNTKETVSHSDDEVENDNEVQKIKTNNIIGESSSVKDNNNKDFPKKNDPSGKTTPLSTQSKLKRERCWYGDKCFRKNPKHKFDFAHPGDEDYASDPDDNRPTCPFNDTCYRTNIIHRRQYKHSKPPAPRPATSSRNVNGESDSEDSSNTGTSKRKRQAAAKQKKYTASPEDDYDLDDPFINDGSSDDFVLTDESDSDSDWLDSQEVAEESQDRKQLLKEAKKFTKKKNKK